MIFVKLIPVQVGPMYDPNDGRGAQPTTKAQMIMEERNGSYYVAGTVAYDARTREWLCWDQWGVLWSGCADTRREAIDQFMLARSEQKAAA